MAATLPGKEGSRARPQPERSAGIGQVGRRGRRREPSLPLSDRAASVAAQPQWRPVPMQSIISPESARRDEIAQGRVILIGIVLVYLGLWSLSYLTYQSILVPGCFYDQTLQVASKLASLLVQYGIFGVFVLLMWAGNRVGPLCLRDLPPLLGFDFGHHQHEHGGPSAACNCSIRRSRS